MNKKQRSSEHTLVLCDKAENVLFPGSIWVLHAKQLKRADQRSSSQVAVMPAVRRCSHLLPDCRRFCHMQKDSLFLKLFKCAMIKKSVLLDEVNVCVLRRCSGQHRV